MTYDPFPRTSLTSVIEWQDMQVKPCWASQESYENFAWVAAPIWPVKSTTGSWEAGAPFARARPAPVRHELHALAVEGIVERGEAMRRPLPLVERVGMAALAVLVRRELLRVEEPLVERLRG